MRQEKRTMLLLAAAIALCPQQAGAATELAAPPIEDSAVTGWTNAAEARPAGATATPHVPAAPARRPGQSIPLDLNDMAAQARIPRVAPAAPLQDKSTAALPLIDWLRADTAMNLIRWLVILAIATLAGAGLRRRHASSNA